MVYREFSGKGYDPRHNSTSLFTGRDLYAATVADFSATDSLIIKNQLRTEQYDYKHLNGSIRGHVLVNTKYLCKMMFLLFIFLTISAPNFV